jgi:hypothetical protein
VGGEFVLRLGKQPGDCGGGQEEEAGDPTREANCFWRATMPVTILVSATNNRKKNPLGRQETRKTVFLSSCLLY